MNQNDRAIHDPNSEGESGRPVTLPTRNPPPGDPGTETKRDDGIVPGQPEVAGTGSDNSDMGQSPITATCDDSRNPGTAQSA